MKFASEIADYVRRQRLWSKVTFGPGRRTEGILKHIEKEMQEVREEPESPKEWLDIVILALDGAWRTGASPAEIRGHLWDKQILNLSREFPYPESEDHISEHIKEEV